MPRRSASYPVLVNPSINGRLAATKTQFRKALTRRNRAMLAGVRGDFLTVDRRDDDNRWVGVALEELTPGRYQIEGIDLGIVVQPDGRVWVRL